MEKKIYKPFNIEVKGIDEDKREITAVGSQQKVDRDGDIIKVDGVDLRNYKKNPIVLWSHNHGDPPIGKTERVWKKDGDLMFKIKYAEPETYSFADTIYKLTKDGYINAFSIGFVPDWESAEPNEKSGGYTFNKTELLEISAVNVPANAGALIESRSIQKALEDKVIDQTELEEMLIYLKNEDGSHGMDDFLEMEPGHDTDEFKEEFKDELQEKEERELENLLDQVDTILENESVEDQEQTINEDTCPTCGKQYIQKEVDSDPFEWLFKEHQTTESKDDSNEDLVDELLKSFSEE